MKPTIDRTNLLAKTCGALSLAAAILTTGYPCHLLAEDTVPLNAVNQANTVIDEGVSLAGANGTYAMFVEIDDLRESLARAKELQTAGL